VQRRDGARPSSRGSGCRVARRTERHGRRRNGRHYAEQVAAANHPDVMVLGELLNAIGAPGTFDANAEPKVAVADIDLGQRFREQ